MFSVNDALDGIYLGCFFFGLLFTVGTLLFGVVDIGGDSDGEVGPLNISSVLAFIAWFGGVGYLTRNGFGAIAVFSLVLALAGGLAGGAFIWWILQKVRSQEQYLDPRDYELPGTIARVTSSIRAGGVGEIIYEQAGVRQVSAARSLDGRAIPRGTEVVVMQTAGGTALVQPWDDVMADVDDGAMSARERDPDQLATT